MGGRFIQKALGGAAMAVTTVTGSRGDGDGRSESQQHEDNSRDGTIA